LPFLHSVFFNFLLEAGLLRPFTPFESRSTIWKAVHR
jgi:hypothetical protein